MPHSGSIYGTKGSVTRRQTRIAKPHSLSSISSTKLNGKNKCGNRRSRNEAKKSNVENSKKEIEGDDENLSSITHSFAIDDATPVAMAAIAVVFSSRANQASGLNEFNEPPSAKLTEAWIDPTKVFLDRFVIEFAPRLINTISRLTTTATGKRTNVKRGFFAIGNGEELTFHLDNHQ